MKLPEFSKNSPSADGNACMCMPFHTDQTVNRLSIDIDLLTGNTVETTDSMMKQLDQEIGELEITRKIPTNPYPISNLTPYVVKYESYSKNPESIKVDFLCSVDIGLASHKITQTIEILDLNINYPATILNRGSLIGDKLTTLALGQIGKQ